jgi:large subunit ribosomal protein L3
MKFLLGKKLKMIQMFAADGSVVPVTLLEALPCTVVQIKTEAKDGYNAVQIGGGLKKHVTKPIAGHVKGLALFARLREYRAKEKEDLSGFKRGDILDVGIFKEGDKVTIVGTTKGKGFQGGVKRHGFHGGPASHGQKHSHREVGSIGGGGRAGGRVVKGKRMPGRMGSDRKTLNRVKIVAVDKENHIIAVSGAVPGHSGSRIEIKAE